MVENILAPIFPAKSPLFGGHMTLKPRGNSCLGGIKIVTIILRLHCMPCDAANKIVTAIVMPSFSVLSHAGNKIVTIIISDTWLLSDT